MSLLLQSLLSEPDHPLHGLLVSGANNYNIAPMNWKETPEAHVFEIELPGLRREDVRLELREGRLVHVTVTVTAAAAPPPEDGDRKEKSEVVERWHCRERTWRGGGLAREFRLPAGSRVEDIRASMRDGVLVITVPKDHNHESNKKTKKKSTEVDIDERDHVGPKGLGRFVCCKA